MAWVTQHELTVLVDAGGDANVLLGPVNGILNSIQYVKTDYADGVDFTITDVDTGLSLWTESDVNASKAVAPHQTAHDRLGVALEYAPAGSEVAHEITLVGHIRIVIANGGVSKTGLFRIRMY